MSKYELPDNVKNNILTFLNRVKVEGFNEVDALNEIRHTLLNPFKDELQENK